MTESLPVVLSVDDEPNIQSALKRVLRKSKMELLFATSGKEALAIIAQQPVDVIISDMRMPGMSGAEFLAQAETLAPSSQRIILSGHSDTEDIVAAINGGGIDAYVGKPWNDGILRKAVEKAAKLARLERENQELLEINSSQNEALQRHNEELEAIVAERTAELTTANDLLNASVDELAASYESMVSLLASVSMLPDKESSATDRKCQLAVALGEAFELDDTQLQTLSRCMRLHRIGWVALPYSIRTVPQRALSSQQLDLFHQHPLYAEALLLSVDKLSEVGKVLRSQNEHFDGTGFPDRKVAQGIPLLARILSVSRDYIDLQRGRIQKESLTPEASLQAMTAESGKRYDPEVIAALATILQRQDLFEPVVPELLVPSHALQPSMRLSRDLTTNTGALLLNRGCTLTTDLITTLTNLERRSDAHLMIYICREDGESQ
ncbi:MAG: response regulator [Pseudomonadaceae bacterium]|nr:response regulator [Pseudomonadaceae bacterium]